MIEVNIALAYINEAVRLATFFLFHFGLFSENPGTRFIRIEPKISEQIKLTKMQVNNLRKVRTIICHYIKFNQSRLVLSSRNGKCRYIEKHIATIKNK